MQILKDFAQFYRINYKTLIVTIPDSEALNGEGFISLIEEKENR